MARRRKPAANPAGGRPARLLETGVHKTLADAIEVGVPITIACQGAGIAEQTFRNWMNRGKAEHEARYDDENPETDEGEQPYLDLYLDILDRRTKAATRNVGVIQKAAQGGSVTNKTIRRYRDHKGNDVEEESITRTAPDWRAAAWYLERSHRSEFAKGADQVEITGAGGGPLQIAPPTIEEELAERLASFLAEGVPQLPALTAAHQITDEDDDGDVYDVEVVEEAPA